MERKAVNRYRLPVPKKVLERIDKTSSPAHVGKLRNAIDFLVPENTPVPAEANGIVIMLKMILTLEDLTQFFGTIQTL